MSVKTIINKMFSEDLIYNLSTSHLRSDTIRKVDGVDIVHRLSYPYTNLLKPGKCTFTLFIPDIFKYFSILSAANKEVDNEVWWYTMREYVIGKEKKI